MLFKIGIGIEIKMKSKAQEILNRFFNESYDSNPRMNPMGSSLFGLDYVDVYETKDGKDKFVTIKSDFIDIITDKKGLKELIYLIDAYGTLTPLTLDEKISLQGKDYGDFLNGNLPNSKKDGDFFKYSIDKYLYSGKINYLPLMDKGKIRLEPINLNELVETNISVYSYNRLREGRKVLPVISILNKISTKNNEKFSEFGYKLVNELEYVKQDLKKTLEFL